MGIFLAWAKFYLNVFFWCYWSPVLLVGTYKFTFVLASVRAHVGDLKSLHMIFHNVVFLHNVAKGLLMHGSWHRNLPKKSCLDSFGPFLVRKLPCLPKSGQFSQIFYPISYMPKINISCHILKMLHQILMIFFKVKEYGLLSFCKVLDVFELKTLHQVSLKFG